MYTMENYYWGLVAYGLGVLLATPLLWWATRIIPWHPVKAFFRILVLVFFLTPMFAYQGMDYLAPAWVVGAFELVEPQTEEGIWRGLLPISICFGLVYILETLLWLIFRKRGFLKRASLTRASRTDDKAPESSPTPSASVEA